MHEAPLLYPHTDQNLRPSIEHRGEASVQTHEVPQVHRLPIRESVLLREEPLDFQLDAHIIDGVRDEEGMFVVMGIAAEGEHSIDTLQESAAYYGMDPEIRALGYQPIRRAVQRLERYGLVERREIEWKRNHYKKMIDLTPLGNLAAIYAGYQVDFARNHPDVTLSDIWMRGQRLKEAEAGPIAVPEGEFTYTARNVEARLRIIDGIVQAAHSEKFPLSVMQVKQALAKHGGKLGDNLVRETMAYFAKQGILGFDHFAPELSDYTIYWQNGLGAVDSPKHSYPHPAVLIAAIDAYIQSENGGILSPSKALEFLKTYAPEAITSETQTRYALGRVLHDRSEQGHLFRASQPAVQVTEPQLDLMQDIIMTMANVEERNREGRRKAVTSFQDPDTLALILEKASRDR